ncbi:hypothetical protein ELQ87_21245 [Streptomyces griseoviridis]|uniref:Hydrophobic W protein n=1 Tax=Streptomyces griseoviridis TaxID=45398 RepID=A0A3S9ZFG1_STRGD|nr:hypothetical protein [Streptomyces griseoviridis]AZS86495.1 hypothetical protein ELQ87_21245 [Streptomyces griseoviridis]
MSNGPNREPSARIPVVIAEDGSAVVDGEPVPVVGGESVDVAILDTLHGYARSRNEAVTASITDPVAGSVAIVEVAPDGSSRLVEQRQEGPAAAVAPTPPPHAVAPAPPQAVALDKPPAPAAPPPGAPAPAAPAPQPPAPAAAQVPPPAQHRQPAPTPAPQPANTPARAPAPVRGIGQSDDEYEAPSLIKRPAVIGAVAVGVALLVIVPLVALGSGGSDGGASDKTAAAADSKRKTPTLLPTQPTVSATPSGWPHATPGVSASPSASASDSASPSPSASPSEEKRKEEETEETKSAEAPVAAVPKPVKPPKPHKETAAEAVSKLAARSPGRHICYRVYFDKDGWQKPVCDGATAGRVNTKQKIKSINTATAGTKGTASNAWVRHDKWKTPWSGGVDGVDVYIGKTKKDYPYILGFVINVADGAVCQNAAVGGRWGGLACDQPTGQAPGNFIWGGTQDDARWLQAVRFTV